eukprot:GHVL01041798.1.p1 GENE.GHVL01041798.1~~GHVL01041798.1.p1  ORF type:complete len:139 (-),score=39.77 GHVL01041798.1:482-898(-)
MSESLVTQLWYINHGSDPPGADDLSDTFLRYITPPGGDENQIDKNSLNAISLLVENQRMINLWVNETATVKETNVPLANETTTVKETNVLLDTPIVNDLWNCHNRWENLRNQRSNKTSQRSNVASLVSNNFPNQLNVR